ncbi:hypothetical protein LNP24_28400 [Klebsiella pneumoniae subsp. pneumoniae]|nr:hypothetical protein [Klebsiella pneumoniae subsp. pneumoniae]
MTAATSPASWLDVFQQTLGFIIANTRAAQGEQGFNSQGAGRDSTHRLGGADRQCPHSPRLLHQRAGARAGVCRSRRDHQPRPPAQSPDY